MSVYKNISPNLYPCFICLLDSSDPMICSNCGSAIEKFDPDAAILLPPEQGRYFVSLSDVPRTVVYAVLEAIRDKYLESFKVKESSDKIEVRSSRIAHELVVEMISGVLERDCEEVKRKITFELY